MQNVMNENHHTNRYFSLDTQKNAFYHKYHAHDITPIFASIASLTFFCLKGKQTEIVN